MSTKFYSFILQRTMEKTLLTTKDYLLKTKIEQELTMLQF